METTLFTISRGFNTFYFDYKETEDGQHKVTVYRDEKKYLAWQADSKEKSVGLALLNYLEIIKENDFVHVK